MYIIIGKRRLLSATDRGRPRLVSPSFVSPLSAPRSSLFRRRPLILSVSAFLSVRPSVRQCTLNVDDSGRRRAAITKGRGNVVIVIYITSPPPPLWRYQNLSSRGREGGEREPAAPTGAAATMQKDVPVRDFAGSKSFFNLLFSSLQIIM